METETKGFIMNETMLPKPIVWVLGVVLILFIALLGVSKAYEIRKQSKDQTQPKNTISISAQGKVQAVPDLATLSVSVTTQGTGTKVADIENKNTEKVNNVINQIKALGVDKKDISTSGPNINERRDYTSVSNGTIVGYDVSQTVTIKVHGVDENTDKVSAVIASATDNGVNGLSGVYYGFDDVDGQKEKAREAAVENAKEKAASLAKTAGISLGKVVSISESGSYNPQPYMSYDMVAPSAGVRNEMKAIAPTLEPGIQDITADMTVVFEVK
jgi:uncharacterized protein YggE